MLGPDWVAANAAKALVSRSARRYRRRTRISVGFGARMHITTSSASVSVWIPDHAGGGVAFGVDGLKNTLL
jgi:hypothetical protein